jgi:hypothetical protein
MRRSSLVLLLVLFLGCKSDPVSERPVFEVSQENASTLVAGGFRLVGSLADTQVFFDATPVVNITNTDESPLTRRVYFEYGVIEGDQWIETLEPLFDTAASKSITFQPGIQMKIEESRVLAISTQHRGKKIGYRLHLDWIDNVGTTVSNVFPSIPFDQRFRGYTITGENSPDPIGFSDLPDDGDWTGSTGFTMMPNYINPFHGSTSLRFSIAERTSLQIDVRMTPKLVVGKIENGVYDAGMWEVDYIDSGLAAGLYRVTYSATQGSIVTSGHGDIAIARH